MWMRARHHGMRPHFTHALSVQLLPTRASCVGGCCAVSPYIAAFATATERKLFGVGAAELQDVLYAICCVSGAMLSSLRLWLDGVVVVLLWMLLPHLQVW